MPAGPCKRRGAAGALRCLRLAILVSLGAVSAAPAVAAPVLQWPLACTVDTDCWTVNYVDTDPAGGASRDFQCGPRTYDGHKGTDFAIRDWAVLERGVDVLAAAAGKVLRTRDGMRDMEPSKEERRRLLAANRGCGNGVILDHGAGWRTMYCHMKRGSIVVREGESVAAGEKLGQVGQSGNAEFPHLHLGVTSGESVIDPYTSRAVTAPDQPAPASGEQACGKAQAGLWAGDVPAAYQPVSFYGAGFSGQEPEFAAIRRDASSPASLPAGTPALAFWVTLFGAARGDRIDLVIRGPQGSVLAEQSIRQERDRARQFYFIGKRNRDGQLPAGVYTGSAVLIRDSAGTGAVERSITRQVTLE